MSTNCAIAAPTRGRPLSTAVERAVFDETLRLVRLPSPHAITRRSIAQGAGVSRQTLYNRWGSTADIVLDALLERAARTIGAGAATDVESYVRELANAVNGWARPGLRVIAAYAQTDRQFGRRFRSEFLHARHGALTAAVAAEVHDPHRAARVAELIAGSMWFRILIADRELDDEWIDEMVALAVTGA